MTALGIDYAWQHPDPAAIKRDGYSFVLRYLSTDPSKNLTAAEAKALHAAGLAIGLVWETTATRAVSGRAGGVADRAEAEKQATALGYPADCALFWACDFDAAPATVMEYARGWADEKKGRQTGPYGSKAVVEAVHQAGFSNVQWQTEAWSGTAVSSQANLYQRVKVTKAPIPGAPAGSYDEDVVLHWVKLWGPSGVFPPEKPAPKPAPPKPAPKPIVVIPKPAEPCAVTPPAPAPPAPAPVAKQVTSVPAKTAKSRWYQAVFSLLANLLPLLIRVLVRRP